MDRSAWRAVATAGTLNNCDDDNAAAAAAADDDDDVY